MPELGLADEQPSHKKIKLDTNEEDHEEFMDVDKKDTNDKPSMKRKYDYDECSMTDQKKSKSQAPAIPPSILRAMPELYNYM